MKNILQLISRYRHINWALADQAMVSGVNFLTGILFARFLGLEEYGRFTLAWMAVLFFNSFQQAGIIAPMMSIGPKQEKDAEAAYYGAVFIHQITWSTGCALLLWIGILLSGVFKPDWHIQNLALPLAATLFAWQLQDFIRRYFFVRSKSALAFLNDTVSYLGQILILVVLFQLTKVNTAQVLWIIAGTSMVAVLIGILKSGPITFPVGMIVTITKNHWHFSKWMLASALTQWFSGNFFFVATGSILGPIAVGGIKAAQNIIGVTHILFQAMENFAPAGATRAFSNGGPPLLSRYLNKLIVGGIAGTAGIALIAFLFPSFLLTCLYGSEYSSYVSVLRWFCIIYIFTFLSMPLSAGLRAIEKTMPIFFSSFCAGIISAVAAYPLTILFGVNGTMFGLFFSKVLVVAILFIAYRPHMNRGTGFYED